jgi:hypothetical protein
MKLVSVIVCTHIPRLDYFRRTIGGLNRQKLSPEQRELLLVDNASDEPLESTCDLSWHPLARHIREERVGLTERMASLILSLAACGLGFLGLAAGPRGFILDKAQAFSTKALFEPSRPLCNRFRGVFQGGNFSLSWAT